MRNLWKQLHPYRWWILLIMLFHVGRAYTTLLLPDYTSKLIDVGIQNAGIEYAVVDQAQASTMKNYIDWMTPEEKNIVDAAYQIAADGSYQLKDAYLKDTTKIQSLEKDWIKVLALEAMTHQEIPGQENSPMKLIKGLPKTMVRPMLEGTLDKMEPSILKGLAIQSLKKDYQTEGRSLEDRQWKYLRTQAFRMIVVTLMSILVAVGAHYLSARISADMGYHLRDRIYRKILAFSQSEMDHFSPASLITRSTNDIQQVSMLMTIILRFALFSPVMAIGGIYHAVKTNQGLSWIIVLAVLSVFVLVGSLLYLTMPRFKILQKQVDQLNLISREVLTGLQVIRSFGREKEENDRFDSANTDLKTTQLFVNRTMSMMMPMMMFIMNAISILIIWVAAHQIVDGQFQVGQLTAFIAYTIQIIFSFMIFSMMAVLLPRAIVSADRIEEVLEEPLKITDPQEAQVISEPKGRVVFDQVSFAYDGSKENALSDINFVAEPGQTTAIIGSTGSGKTTLLSLLLRMYDVTEGSIQIDGVDIRNLRLKDLRELIGYVPQKGVLFSGDVASNIKFASGAITDDKMQAAAEIAHASEFIEGMDQTFKADISQGGANLSGGQKQRLSIARAIAKDPKIYLFDDSFSALDYRTDAKVRRALNQMANHETIMIIAQRVSTIIHADKIIVLEQGKIVGQGTHQELLATCLVYLEIASSQLSEEEIKNTIQQAQEKGGVDHV